ncbi:hypothetical protein GKODMF_00010 [Candidatus Electrothrix gigas]
MVFFFSGEEITWLLWIIIPAAYIAIFSSFIVLPVAIFKGWKAIRDKKILMFLQYVVVSVMTAGITAGFIMVLFYSRGRH